jgi:rRNA-processing protein FCF1
MTRVILDASLLIRCAELKVDLYADLARIIPGSVELVVLDRTLGELRGIASGSTKEGRAAKLALLLLQKKGVVVIPAGGPGDVDTLILNAARTSDVVATQDMGLKRRLRQKHVRLAVLREKQHVVLVG